MHISKQTSVSTSHKQGIKKASIVDEGATGGTGSIARAVEACAMIVAMLVQALTTLQHGVVGDGPSERRTTVPRWRRRRSWWYRASSNRLIAFVYDNVAM